MRPVAADEILGVDMLLAVVPADRRRHAGPVLGEVHQLPPALDPGTESSELRTEDPLGLVLGESDEAVGDVVGQYQVGAADEPTVDERELTAHRRARVQGLPGNADGVPDLEGAWLQTHGLGPGRDRRPGVHDEDVDATPTQFDGGRQADGPGAGDEHCGGLPGAVDHRVAPLGIESSRCI